MLGLAWWLGQPGEACLALHGGSALNPMLFVCFLPNPTKAVLPGAQHPRLNTRDPFDATGFLFRLAMPVQEDDQIPLVR